MLRAPKTQQQLIPPQPPLRRVELQGKCVTRILCLYENSLKKTFANRQQSEVHMFDTSGQYKRGQRVTGYGGSNRSTRQTTKANNAAKEQPHQIHALALLLPHKHQPNGAPSSLPHLLWQPEAMAMATTTTTMQTFVFDFVTSLYSNNNSSTSSNNN